MIHMGDDFSRIDDMNEILSSRQVRSRIFIPLTFTVSGWTFNTLYGLDPARCYPPQARQAASLYIKKLRTLWRRLSQKTYWNTVYSTSPDTLICG